MIFTVASTGQSGIVATTQWPLPGQTLFTVAPPPAFTWVGNYAVPAMRDHFNTQIALAQA